MRDIKFRGIRCSLRYEGQDRWVYGNYVESSRSWHGCHPHKSWILPSPYTNGGWFSLAGAIAVKDETVGQFTGLYDKNGKEIYEGDILLWNERKLFIKWRQKDCRYVLIGCHDNDYVLNAYKCNIEDDFKVIGNIHNNPELMEGGNQ